MCITENVYNISTGNHNKIVSEQYTTLTWSSIVLGRYSVHTDFAVLFVDGKHSF